MIRLEGITKTFGSKKVITDLSFSLPENGIIVISGDSGKGKTTLLNILAGIYEPDSGKIEGIQGLNIGYAFQDDRLLPWKTALDNVSIAAEKEEAEKWLCRFELGDSLTKYPRQLSGGMSKRVNLARAFASNPQLLLLDEPTSGIDEQLKCNKIIPAIKEFSAHIPVIIVTHIEEDKKLLGEYEEIIIK